MEKRYLIFDMNNKKYYTGMYYYDEKEAWDNDYAMAERFKSIDIIDDIINDSDENSERCNFFSDYSHLEIKTIFVKI